jgi:hypothetical protein
MSFRLLTFNAGFPEDEVIVDEYQSITSIQEEMNQGCIILLMLQEPDRPLETSLLQA